MMRLLPRALGFVLAAAAILHFFRVPLGSDLWQFPAADASGSYARRAIGLGILALVCSRFVTRKKIEEEDHPGRARLAGEAAGFTLAGAGASVALEALARHSRSLITTAPIDGTILGATLLLLGLFGALAFAPLFEGERRRAFAVALGTLICALLCIVSLRTLNGLATPQGFDAYVRQFGLRASQRGYFTYTALLGGTLFALPAFALGTAAACAKRRELMLLLVGGALGLLLVPRLLSSTNLSDPLIPSPFSAGLVRVGILLAAVGAAIAVASLHGSKGKTRLVGLALAGAGVAAAFIAPIHPIVISNPWQRRPAQPTLVVDAPEGLFLVDGGEQGFAYASLDGRALTPRLEDAGLDAAAMETTIALLPSEVRARELHVLLIGVLTPGRALALGSGATIDRTASFFEVMPALESALFEPGGYKPHAKGEVLSPEAAAERLEAGRYDLVIAPPVLAGPTPKASTTDLNLAPSPTTVALWIDASSSLAGTEKFGSGPDEGVLLAADGLERIAFALVRGPDVQKMGEAVELYGSEPRTLRLGDPVLSPPSKTWLSTRTHRKGRICVERLATRLEAANAGSVPTAEKLTRALARASQLQHESSPFADEAASTEIDELSLTLLREAALEQTPDFFTARFIERMGRTLLGKGWIDETHKLLEPIAERYAPRPELETRLAEAEIEGLLFEDALARLDRIAGPENGERALLHAHALSGLGRPEEALPILRRVKIEGLVDSRTVRLALATTLAELDPTAALAELADLAQLIGHDDELERIEEELRARFALEGVEVPEPKDADHDSHDGHDH